MTDEATAPAGWYDDGTGRQRWFDGAQWGAYADEDEATPTETVDPVAAAATSSEPVVVRRTRRAPFIPPQEDVATESSVTVSRNWGLGVRAAHARQDSGMTRNRTIAGDLPAWSPMPPGELGVRRGGGQRP